MLAWLLVLCLIMIFYTWLGYGVVLAGLSRFRTVRLQRRPITPLVSIIVAARNEETQILGRLVNLLELDYPREQFEILVASDGSTDRTAEIALTVRDERIRLSEFSQSRGRAAVHNDLAAKARGEVLVFTDAATRFAPLFLRTLMRNFADSRVGCVSGVINFGNQDASAVCRQRGLYWRYEYWLRSLESGIGILVCASGPCMAVRRELFRPLRHLSYDVDFMTPLDVAASGFLVLQEEQAIARDEMFATPRQELRAEVRMVSRNFAGYLDRRFLLTSRKYAWFAWSLISHKVLRWATPFVLLVLFVSTGILAAQRHLPALWLSQVLFYGAALVGWFRTRNGQPAYLFALPFAFCLANVGFFLGLVKAFRKQRITTY
jgi:cellulose synthase/poly-beta-1,6-N-acetylglucosamine synthase-like glycosyltransferase